MAIELKYLTFKEAMAELRVSESQLKQAVSDGLLAALVRAPYQKDFEQIDPQSVRTAYHKNSDKIYLRTMDPKEPGAYYDCETQVSFDQLFFSAESLESFRIEHLPKSLIILNKDFSQIEFDQKRYSLNNFQRQILKVLYERSFASDPWVSEREIHKNSALISAEGETRVKKVFRGENEELLNTLILYRSPANYCLTKFFDPTKK